MNITQALRRVSAIKGELSDVSGTLVLSATYFEDAPPAYKFKELKEQRDILVSELVQLKAQVAKANAVTVIEDGTTKRTLISVIHELAQLKGTIELFKSVNSRPQDKGTDKDTDWEYSDDGKQIRVSTERAWTCDLPVRARDQELKKLRHRFAQLNNLVEQANASTEV
jgi:hypothetical protein